MTRPSTYLMSTLLLTIVLAFGCGDDNAGGPTVNSQLLGIYEIGQYQVSTVGCENPPDADPPAAFVALYSHVTDEDPTDPLFLGRFCGSVEGCRNAIRDFPEVLTPGYSFIDGNDASGWRGWSIAGVRLANDQCRADVQAHVLTSTSGSSIQIETKLFDTVFDGEPDPDVPMRLNCENEAALAALRDDPPCTEIFVVEADFAAGL